MVCSAFHSIKAVVSQVGALWTGFLGGVRAENIWHQCPSHWQTPFFNWIGCYNLNKINKDPH